MSKVRITADFLDTVNYALFHNGIPVGRRVEVTNESDSPLEDVRVECEGEYMVSTVSDTIGLVSPAETVVTASLGIRPDHKRLAAVTERVTTDVTLRATSHGEPVGETRLELQLMPFDHWTGTGVLPQTICSFITPNHPFIDRLMVKSGQMLKRLTGESFLSGYQSGDPNNVRRQVAAVFAALHDEGIVYRGMAASFEAVGQRINMPGKVLASKIGNCLELTLLMAAVLEAAGINTLIIFQRGHAFLGIWLVDDCYPCSVCDDASFIEKSCSEGIGEMMVLESTMLAREATSFEEAERIAAANLAKHEVFDMFVDVKRSRLERIYPLPVKIEADGSEWLDTDAEGVAHDNCVTDVREHDRYDLTQVAAPGRELTKFDIWERKLLDFSLRNALLNLSPRLRAVQFISFDINLIEDHLQDGKEYEITHKPEVDFTPDLSGRLVRSCLYEPLHALITNDINHHLLHTYLTEAETTNVLKNIYRAARNAIEETGANSLFLAIGTLRWFENEASARPRYAPLLLLPVELIYRKGRYYIRTRDEEITLNITLMEFLRQNYDITIGGLDPLPLDHSGVDVPRIFAIIRDALKSRHRWDVEEECVLGTFSFSKFMMWNDLHNHHDRMAESSVIEAMANGELISGVGGMPDPGETDGTLSPADTALPVPVDSSQLAAVIASGRGGSFILYGPPGTGKSQTITNLIANALYHGKRVLFVAEKMAALNVVQSRLEKIGLGPFCLELHSNKSTKRHVLDQLKKALDVRHIMSPADHQALAEKIFEIRKELIANMEALHTPDASDGLSAYDAITRYESIEGEPMKGFRHDGKIDELLLKSGTREVDDMLGSRLATMIRLVGQPSINPLKGLRADAGMVSDNEGEAARMREAAAALEAVVSDYNSLSSAGELRSKLLRDNKPEILDLDPAQLRREWRTARARWWGARYFATRAFMARLREYNPLITREETEPLLDSLYDYHDRHERIAAMHALLKRYFNVELADDQLPEAKRIRAWEERLRLWADNSGGMRDWYHWVTYSDELRQKGLGCVADAFESREMEASGVRDAYLKALYKHKADKKLSRTRRMATFEGMVFDEKVALYKKLAAEFQHLTRLELYARLAARVPHASDSTVNGSEIGLLNRNISNGARGLSLRGLFDQIPTLLPRLCPCMLMSPMSVAQYLDIDSEKFDLVVFDEASQMPTSEAVGAIARGKAVVVVGDPKQMPPTSFFTSTNVSDDEAAIDDMESILEDCRTLEMPSLQLSWHYRSRHESLIAFSNNEYYDGGLITFPSVDDQRTKVRFVAVKGQYDRGNRRSNRTEAVRLVDEIVRRLRSEELRSKSIGVIAFSVTQQGLIEDILQERLDADQALREAAAGMYEPIFVKNLENVQGDERDVILFSIGYGPDKAGRVSMNFGPLNNAGGERRLNVAVSRARCEMLVYSSIRSSDIDLRRSKARGVEGLKHFLEYAESGMLPAVASAARTAARRTAVAEGIARALRESGYKVATGVGRSQFRVDVAVESAHTPGAYQLALLLDGEDYRDTPTTRDREIVKPSVLEALGWKVMRVWSADWLRSRERVLNRIKERLEEEAADEATDEMPLAQASFDIMAEDMAETDGSNAQEYTRYEQASLQVSMMTESDLMKAIIAEEQPVRFGYLCRRMAQLRGTRVSDRLQRIYTGVVREFYNDGLFGIWLSREDSLDYKGYRPASGRDITDIPLVEVMNAMMETLAEQVALSEDDLVATAARKLGFARRGNIIDVECRKALDALRKAGRIEEAGGRVRMAEGQ